MRVRILDLAEADLLGGVEFYESQSEGIGWYFLESLYSDIESLRLHAGLHSKKSGFFRALSHRFPFAIYYKTTETEIQVWRILDCRRDPRWIKNQLDET